MTRDVTRALEIVTALEAETSNTAGWQLERPLLAELRQILETIDARTGRRDPTKRPKRPKRP